MKIKILAFQIFLIYFGFLLWIGHWLFIGQFYDWGYIFAPLAIEIFFIVSFIPLRWAEDKYINYLKEKEDKECSYHFKH
jgi:uncharacterized membrane protein (DUF485 family)